MSRTKSSESWRVKTKESNKKKRDKENDDFLFFGFRIAWKTKRINHKRRLYKARRNYGFLPLGDVAFRNAASQKEKNNLMFIRQELINLGHTWNKEDEDEARKPPHVGAAAAVLNTAVPLKSSEFISNNDKSQNEKMYSRMQCESVDSA